MLALVKMRHSGTEWAFFDEIPDATGYDKNRTLDAYAMHLWPSKKFLRIAYEIKASRSDLFNDLKNPHKRQSALDVSNQFYFVCTKGIIQLEELPEGVGLLEADAGGLKIRRVAPHREVEDLPMSFVASLLRAGSREMPLEQELKLFKWAGRDLSEADFKKVLEENFPAEMEVQIHRQVREGVDKHLKDHELAKFATKVAELTGRAWDYADLDEVIKWLKDQRNGIPLKALRGIQYDFKLLHERMGKIVARFDEADKKEEEEADADEDSDGDGGETDPVQPGDGGAGSQEEEVADTSGDHPPAGDVDAPQGGEKHQG